MKYSSGFLLQIHSSCILSVSVCIIGSSRFSIQLKVCQIQKEDSRCSLCFNGSSFLLFGWLGRSSRRSWNLWRHGKWWLRRDHLLELWYIELGLWRHCWGWADAEGNGLGWRRQVLVGVETSDGSDVRDVRYLDHRVLLTEAVHVLVWGVWRKITLVINGMIITLIMVVVVLVALIVSWFLEFFGHWRKGDALWEVWKRVDESSLLICLVVEGASFTELALPSFFPELAWNRLIVGMDGAKSSFTEIFRKRL